MAWNSMGHCGITKNHNTNNGQEHIEELTPKGGQGKGRVDLERASQTSNSAQMIVLPGACDFFFYSMVGMSQMDQTF